MDGYDESPALLRGALGAEVVAFAGADGDAFLELLMPFDRLLDVERREVFFVAAFFVEAFFEPFVAMFLNSHPA